MQDRDASLRRTSLQHFSAYLSFLAAITLTACAAVTGSSSAPAVTANPSVTALRELERPVLAAAKEALSALLASDSGTATDRLETIRTRGQAILDWLDAHPDFARVNAAATGCLRETMTDLGEQAESLVPALRRGSASPDQLTKLRTDLGEAANCIQSSD